MLATICLLISGCGGDGYSLVPVEGRITDRGKPVTGASVTFHPIASGKENPGPASFGITDGDGRYVLHTYNDDRLGAVVGRHQVRVSTAARDEQPEFAAVRSVANVPRKFQDGTTVAEVPTGGLPAADYDLAGASP